MKAEPHGATHAGISRASRLSGEPQGDVWHADTAHSWLTPEIWRHRMASPAPHMPSTAIDPATNIGEVALAVADLERAIMFYRDALGFAVLQRDAASAALGVGQRALLRVSARAGAQPAPRHATGLYHVAILVPSRADLGRWLRHWLELGYPLPGQADHSVSEALYLSDPDDNGIEIYRDRPRDTWHWDDGQIRMATDPLDITGLLRDGARDGAAWGGMADGTRLGHVHLQVGDIDQAEAFYHGVLGFDVVARMPGALFVSAGGYHHRLAMNTWHSRGSGPAPSGASGLRYFTLELPSDDARAAVLARVREAGITLAQTGDGLAIHDPWQDTIILHAPPKDERAKVAGDAR